MRDNLKDLKLDNLLEREHIGIGSETWACISMLMTPNLFLCCEDLLYLFLQKKIHLVN